MIAERQEDRQAEREAADWYARLSRTPVETEDLEAFYAWRRDPRNDAAYKRMEDIGRAVRELRGDPDMAAAARAALDRGATKRRRESRRKVVAFSIGGPMTAAACVAGVTILLRAPRTFDTDVGQMTVVRLEDGSRLSLNTDSRVRVRFTKGERHVELIRGQAFFEVAHDTTRPFLVSSGSTEVRAVGTQFDVRADGSNLVRVVLAEGRVAVRDDDVAAGMMGKLKTVLQMVTVALILLNNLPFELLGIPVSSFMLWFAALVSFASGVQYFNQMKEDIMESK